LLPSVAAAEVFQDLKTKADADGFNDGQVAFELAACYFNGSLTTPDIHLGLKYLLTATALGNLNAIGSAINVFEACNRDMPPGIRDIVEEWLSENGSNDLLTAVLDPLILPLTVNHYSIRNNTWARIFPAHYALLISGDKRHLFNSVIAKLVQLPESFQPSEAALLDAFDFGQMHSYRMQGLGYEKLSVESEIFVNEVRQLGCLNGVDEYGLTLLQTAVARNDLPMVKVLVHELRANVNAIGNTAGWTPLWLSCLFGYHDIAMFLQENGADPTCRDTEHGTTILHTITQFSEEYQVRDIVNMALDAGLDINVCNSTGMTPLHAIFIRWDYSRGAAARVLLEKGADPTRKAPDREDFVTPIGLCMRNLDSGLLESMVKAVEGLPGASTADARRNLGKAKSQAFRWLVHQTRFYFMCVVGKGYEAALASVLRLIVDADMASELASDKLVTSGISPLYCACHLGRGHIVQALLEAVPNLDLDSIENDPARERSCLQFVIERRSGECIQILLKNGAEILRNTPRGNALHAAAQFYPSLVPQLVTLVDAMSPEQRGGKTMKEILDLPNKYGFSVFGLLLGEGYSVDIAESIRSKYDLDYDSLVETDERSPTLTGVLMAPVERGFIPVGNLSYLLNLSPPPRFLCGGNGSTLLMRAVAGWRSRKSPTYSVLTILELNRPFL
jgi:ankyrin repeat protein